MNTTTQYLEDISLQNQIGASLKQNQNSFLLLLRFFEYALHEKINPSEDFYKKILIQKLLEQEDIEEKIKNAEILIQKGYIKESGIEFYKNLSSLQRIPKNLHKEKNIILNFSKENDIFPITLDKDYKNNYSFYTEDAQIPEFSKKLCIQFLINKTINTGGFFYLHALTQRFPYETSLNTQDYQEFKEIIKPITEKFEEKTTKQKNLIQQIITPNTKKNLTEIKKISTNTRHKILKEKILAYHQARISGHTVKECEKISGISNTAYYKKKHEFEETKNDPEDFKKNKIWGELSKVSKEKILAYHQARISGHSKIECEKISGTSARTYYHRIHEFEETKNDLENSNINSRGGWNKKSKEKILAYHQARISGHTIKECKKISGISDFTYYTRRHEFEETKNDPENFKKNKGGDERRKISKEKIIIYHQARISGHTIKECEKISGISTATYYHRRYEFEETRNNPKIS